MHKERPLAPTLDLSNSGVTGMNQKADTLRSGYILDMRVICRDTALHIDVWIELRDDFAL
jgi:hypothetical protein